MDKFIYMEFLFKNWFQNTNLSIHIARFSASESLQAYPNIYKNSPPFASSKGVPNRESPASVKAHVPVSHMVISINIYGSVGRREGPVNRQVCILKSIFK